MDINNENNENEIVEDNKVEVKEAEDIETVEDNETETEEDIQPEKEPVLGFEYDVKNEEEEKAFIAFQKKFVYAHNWKVTAAFGVVAALFIVSIINNPSTYLNWVLAFICLAVIVLTWYNTRRIRKYLMQALKPLEDDRYIFTLYEDSFKIETIPTEEEKQEEDFTPVPPRIVNFEDISLNVLENDEMFIIILKKETIYVLAKRVMSDGQQKILRKTFSELLDSDYEVLENK
ncbi:hypothetical protein [Ruminococcus sp.]|uniref:hypothetical protein n=1 Tax=Ruminococcus sp. TaxID=41978 RepID=UPI0025EE9429|nr:hypothetical protein [Ruminococcus sp.]